MSQYADLDAAITATIKLGRNSFHLIFASKLVFDESLRISRATGRETYRIVDGRLQSLRKRGLIDHSSTLGWHMKEA